MIRIVLLGRTGNHLFQYALGRVLAERHGTGLMLDGSLFNAAGWAEVSHLLRLPLRGSVVRRCSLGARGLRKITGRHYWEYRGAPVLRESGSDQSFDRRFLEAPADCVVMGYFQSPLYFQSQAEPLRSELNELIGGAVASAPDLQARLRGSNSVAVHVRRTDFLQQAIFQVCDTRYYLAAMREMRARVPGARFFIFSDDAAWCRSEFREADQEVMDAGRLAGNPLHDLHLMSLASHHIIANSSYSWWAAWLGNKPGQSVLMPQQWFAHGIVAPIEEKRLDHWEVVQPI